MVYGVSLSVRGAACRAGRLATALFWRCLWTLALLQSSFVASAELADTLDRLRNSVVAVGTLKSAKHFGKPGPAARFTGTGFIVGNGRQVITNDHVLPASLDAASGETLVVFSGRGENAKALAVEIIRRDAIHDLALLSFAGQALPALTLDGSDEVREGQRVAFTGFPLGMVLGLYPVTHRGIISAISPIVIPAHTASTLTAVQIKRMRNPFNVYQLDATAYPGNSGSPVYNPHSGAVLGVLNSVLVKRTKESLLSQPSGISYAIPVQFVVRLLQGGGIKPLQPTERSAQ